MSANRFQFTAEVTTRDFGRMAYTVVFAPESAARELRLRERPRLRITGSIAGTPFSGAFQPNGNGWYLILSKRFRDESGVELGDHVVVDFEIADPDRVEVPKDLMAALRRRSDVLEAWERLTPGRRRGLAHRVASARRPETREQRILEVIEQVVDAHCG